MGSIRHAEASEPLGIIVSKDAPIRIEIIDTLPRTIRWNTPYRVTHYIRNSSGSPIFLYFLSRRVEINWGDNWGKTGNGREETIEPDNVPSGQQPFVYLGPNESFVSSVEDSFGDRERDGKVGYKGAFHIGFIGTIEHQFPQKMQIRFVYRFTLDPTNLSENFHEVATGWKTIFIEAPNKSRQHDAGVSPVSRSHRQPGASAL